MSYFKHKTLIVEAFQFILDEGKDPKVPFIDFCEEYNGKIRGVFVRGRSRVNVYPGDWVVFGKQSKRFVMDNASFKEFFEWIQDGS